MNQWKLWPRPASVSAVFVLSFSFVVAKFPLSLRAQTTPPAVRGSLQGMARDLSQQWSSRKLKVVVFDFVPPNVPWSPFGAYLADEFSAALATEGGPLTVIDRSQLAAALTSLGLQPQAEFNYENDKPIAEKLAIDCVIKGSYAKLQGDLGITLVANCPNEPHNSFGVISRKLAFTPEMAAHLGAPLETLQPPGFIAVPGRGGIGYPSCVKCPAASYTSAAQDAKYEGTVLLVGVITPEGRATEVKILKGLKYGLDDQALAAVKRWKFAPARDLDGNPVGVRQAIEVTFRLN
jgi:TonB family protein